MATSTTNYSFTLPEVGGDTDQWGTQLNANWTLADSTIKTIEDSVVDVTLTGNDYLTISGQAITVGDVDLTTDVTGTLPVGSGGTGLAALGSANQVLGVNSGGTALEFQTLSTGGTVTSVAVTGSDGIEVDSGSPITNSGTIALGINSTSLSTHLGLGSLATQSTITESQISDLGSYITASSTDTLTNKSGNISQWTNDSGYLTAETNDLSSVSGTLAIANGGTGSSSAATARVALLPTLATNGSKLVSVNSGATDIEYISTSTLSITESQISDLQSYLTAETNDLSAAVTWANVPDVNITESSVTQHQAALSITESQISDFGSYQTTDAGLTSIAGLTTAADKMIYTTAADTYAVSTLTTAGRALLDDADAAAQRTTLGLGSAATSDTSAFEASGAVSTHAALTSGVHGISSFGATLVDDADASAARTTLGLGSIATQDSDSIAVTGGSATLGALTVSGSDSVDLVRITQTGTGNALVVEDETNPDSTPFVVDASGNVGIGITPSTKLVVSGISSLGVNENDYINARGGNGTARLEAVGTNTDVNLSLATKGSGTFYFWSGGYGGTERMRIDSSGALILAGSTAQKATGTTWSNPSDQRLKSNISDYPKGTAELMQVRVREWEYNGKGGTVAGTKGLGVIADEIMTVLPNTVDNYEAKLNVDDEETTQIKKFDATEITWLLVKTTQEQQTIIESQQSQIDALTTRIEALETT